MVSTTLQLILKEVDFPGGKSCLLVIKQLTLQVETPEGIIVNLIYIPYLEWRISDFFEYWSQKENNHGLESNRSKEELISNKEAMKQTKVKQEKDVDID